MGKINTSSSYLKAARPQNQPYQNRGTCRKKLRRYEDDSQYIPTTSVKRMVQDQQMEGLQEENKIIKTIRARDFKTIDLDYFFEKSFSCQDREYPSSFSQESIDVLEKSREKFFHIMFKDRSILIDILTKNIAEVKDNLVDITLLLELSLIANIINNKTNINSFISKFRTFINDTLHLTNNISWFSFIKELLVKEVDNNKSIITVEHIYQAICRLNKVANQQETSVENNLSLDTNIQTVACDEAIEVATENYPDTETFISRSILAMEGYDIDMISPEIATFLTNKLFDLLNTYDQKDIIKELVFFITKSQDKLVAPHYVVQFYLSLLYRIMTEEKLDGKSLDEICNGTSEFFSKWDLEVTSQQLRSMLCHYADPKKNKHIDIERVVMSSVFEAMFADQPL